MDVAAFIIGLVALLLSTITLTLQLSGKVLKKEPEQQLASDPFESDEVSEEELPPRTQEQIAAIDIQNMADINRMNDAFGNPDIPYTGIDDEFENF